MDKQNFENNLFSKSGVAKLELNNQDGFVFLVLCMCSVYFWGFLWFIGVKLFPIMYVFVLHFIVCVCVFQARNKTGKVGYVPEKYLQFPTSNSLLSMLQSLATLDARSHTSSNSTEPELHSNCINGDANSK